MSKKAAPAKPRTKKPPTAKQILDLDRLNILWRAHQREELTTREQELRDLPEGADPELKTQLQDEITRLQKDIEQ